jgi:nucleotide-binding universal stress UspA family protein
VAVATAGNHGFGARGFTDAAAMEVSEHRSWSLIEMSLAPTNVPPVVWDRVVCGINGTAASLEAARAVAWLMSSGAQLTLCAVVNPPSIDGGVLLEKQLTRAAEDALDQAQREIASSHDAELCLREGPPIRLLLDELIAERATLVAVGSHGPGRVASEAADTVATAMLQNAPCSVLIAHSIGRADVPRAGEVVVGFDGSGGARRALAAGRELVERLSLKLRVIVATGSSHPPDPGWSDEELGSGVSVSEDPRPAVDVLVDGSAAASLLIVGSRHLRGAPALSSVSERVAHGASCPVLVVR